MTAAQPNAAPLPDEMRDRTLERFERHRRASAALAAGLAALGIMIALAVRGGAWVRRNDSGLKTG